MVGEATLTVKSPIKATSIAVCPANTTIKVGCSTQLNAEVYPYNTQDKRIRWSSDNCNIADVDPYTGCVCGKSAGTTYIYANAQDGSGVRGYCGVTVRSTAVTGISLNKSSYTFDEVGKSTYLYATVKPSNATNKSVTWSTSDDSVVSVNQYGRITAVSTNGKNVASAVITATTDDGDYEASCTVTVDTREKVTVSKDGSFNKITFASGKVWQCINCDMINDDTNARDLILINRLAQNTYSNIVTDNYGNTGYYDPISYTDNEIKLIYTIDPLGLSAYIQEKGVLKFRETGELKDALDYKDSIFYLLYNRHPKYYKRNTLGTWYESTDTSNLNVVVSESELLFGGHPIYDGKFWLEFVTIVLDIISFAVACPTLKIPDKIAKGIKFGIKYYTLLRSVSKSVLDEDFNGFVSAVANGIAEEEDLDGIIIVADKEFKVANYNMGWAFALLSFSSDLGTIADTFNNSPHFYKEIFTHCSEDLNYNIMFKTIDNKLISISEINSVID